MDDERPVEHGQSVTARDQAGGAVDGYGPHAAGRMRVRRGRVMHAVEHTTNGWIRSRCRKVVTRGLPAVPRAYAPAGDWSAFRYWYPDCRHCPPEEPA